MTHKEIKDNYEAAKNKRIRDFGKACDAYVKEFCRMYDFNYKDACCIPQDKIGVGSVYAIADYYFDFVDIRLCVDEDVEWKDLIEWYDYTLEAVPLGFNNINLKSWLMGAPRATKEEIERIKSLRNEIDDIVKNANEKNGGY